MRRAAVRLACFATSRAALPPRSLSARARPSAARGYGGALWSVEPFPGIAGDSILAFYGPVLFLMGVASIVLGGVAAVSRPDMDGLLAYSSISQVGFIVVPLAIGATVPAVRPLAITAALVYALNHAVAKGTLFMASGAIADATGANEFADLGGLLERSPTVSWTFFLGALALIGIPPLSGFFGKLLVFDTAGRAGSTLGLTAVLGGAILTIAYFSRAWNRAFWGPQTEAVRSSTANHGLVAVVAALALTLVVIGVGFDPVYGAAEIAASAALDRSAYVDLVLGGAAS